MTLIVEDGTGVTNANTFNTVEVCSAHAVLIFGASLSGSTSQKESALVRAFIYMRALDWKADADGVSLWPTFGGTIPEQVKEAQSVLARAEFRNVAALSPDVTVSGKKVLTQVEGIGWTPQSAPNTVEAARPIVTMAMDLLRPWLARDPARNGSRTGFIERA